MDKAAPLPKKWHHIQHDILLLSIMMALAACGLIYEYLLSHYAGRILGVMEATIYGMIGLMIVAMGLGAWAAKWVKHPFTTFAWLEAGVALIGCTATLCIAGIIALTQTIPQIIANTYQLPPDHALHGGIFLQLQTYSRYLPYAFGFVLGVLIGMEIPLIARVREILHGRHLENNVGTIYGADYIGAGFGALLWIFVMLSLEITQASVWTALLNLIAGLIFLTRYWREIKFAKLLLIIHFVMLILLAVIADSGSRWMAQFANVLYTDNVVYRRQTLYQHITFTQRELGHGTTVIDMYLNGRLQFSSQDEQIYHSMLTYPALAASRRQDHVLVIGGGDGLAVRDILKWSPKTVTLIDLDAGLVGLFSHQHAKEKDPRTSALRERLVLLNEGALDDPRVNIIFEDAFVKVDDLLAQNKRFDTIVVDLPDPSHPDLNKLYSDYFYARLHQLLTGDGAISIQSTSPYHAKNAFISIGKTVKYAGFEHVQQYRQNVPSFGEWGWTIATKMGLSPKTRLTQSGPFPVTHDFINQSLTLAAFELPSNFYDKINAIDVNVLGTGKIYRYHTQAWEKEIGVYSP